MDNLLISIITPVYNSSNFVTETIHSVMNQTYTNWELILIDDGSTDGSVNIMKDAIKEDKRISLVCHEQNRGMAEARNSGTKLAKGNYISFIDSDDLWDSKKLEVQLQHMLKNNCLLSHTAYRKIDETGKTLVELIPVSDSVNYKGLLKHNQIGLSTSMYNVDVLGKRFVGTIGWADFCLWLDILKDTSASYGIKQPLVSYRIHQNSSSYNKFKSAQKTWMVYRRAEGLSLAKSLFYFTFYIVNSSLKYLRR